MKRSDLIARIAQRQHRLPAHDVKKVVDVVLDEIVFALAHGSRVELRGFGTFAVRERQARIGRNPKSGEQINVSTKRAPFFKAGRVWSADCR
jgi:integration host factor subunit beta